MLQRLIEVALPLKDISEQSAREKSIRQGHISTLHVWWARRPLATCRAAVFASLIPDPDDPECPEEFRRLVMDVLKHERYRPSSEGNGTTVKDTPRSRCLEFIKHLVRWENSNNAEFIGQARILIAAAHKFLNPGAEGSTPKVLDPFAGGGAIPLEALRLGCDAQAIDLNPVAHLIELCTLVYPQRYGQPDCRPVPDYIKRLIAQNRVNKRDKAQAHFFEGPELPIEQEGENVVPDVQITEAEYRKNPLAADVKYWGEWIQSSARRILAPLYPHETDGGAPFAYLWARTVQCSNPTCGFTVPLITNLWLLKKGGRRVALRMNVNHRLKSVRFDPVDGSDIDFDPDSGTILRGSVACPACEQVASSTYLKQESQAGRMGEQLIAVAIVSSGRKGMTFRTVGNNDLAAFQRASDLLKSVHDNLPSEQISTRQPRLMWITTYGIKNWKDLFNARQSVALGWLCRKPVRIAES
jgi:adenine-specific DNA methylase